MTESDDIRCPIACCIAEQADVLVDGPSACFQSEVFDSDWKVDGADKMKIVSKDAYSIPAKANDVSGADP
jgi:hypothetical protein